MTELDKTPLRIEDVVYDIVLKERLLGVVEGILERECRCGINESEEDKNGKKHKYVCQWHRVLNEFFGVLK